MTRSHRRTHRIAFILLAIILPALIAVAVAGRPPVEAWPLPAAPGAAP